MAITVPVTRERSVQQSAISGQKQQIDAPAAAFGTPQAEAMQRAGNAALRLGEQWNKKAINIADENNELYALQEKTRIETEMSDLAYNPEGGLLTLKGKNALNAPQMVQKKMDALQMSYDSRTDLNPDVRNMLNKSLLQTRQQYSDLAKRHQLQEYTSYKTETLNSAIDANNNSIALNYMDDKQFQAKADENFQLLQSRAVSEGWDDSKLQAEKTKAYAQMRGAQIQAMLYSNDPQKIVIANEVFKEATARGQIMDAKVFADLQKDLQVAVPKAMADIQYKTLKTSISGSEAVNKAASIAARNGIDPEFAAKVAMIESAGNPMAKNPKSSAAGLYQFTDGTAERYGLTDKMDVSASSKAFVMMTKNNQAYLTKKLGREPTNGELYLAHQQGEGGAVKLLSNPKRSAVSIVGRDAVINNGGREDMTAAEFASLWTDKFDRTQVPFDENIIPESNNVYAIAETLEKEQRGAGQELIALYESDRKAITAQKKAKHDDVQDRLQDVIYQNNGDYTKVPIALRAEAAKIGIDYTQYKGISNPEMIATLDSMPSAQLFSLDLNSPEIARELSYDKKLEYMKKQKDLAKPENKYMADMVDGVVSYYFTSQKGVDPTDKDNKPRVAEMKNYVMYQVQSIVESGKKPTKQEITKIAAEFLTQKKNADIGEDGIRDIPEQRRAQIEQRLLSVGREPTDAAIMAVYIEDVNSGRAEPEPNNTSLPNTSMMNIVLNQFSGN